MTLLSAPDVPALRLLFLLIPVAVVWGVFRHFRVGEERRLLLGCARATVQLSFCAFLLRPLFGLGDDFRSLLVLGFICVLASLFSLRALRGRLHGLAPLALLAIVPVVPLLCVGGVLLMEGVKSFEASVVIALGGMLAGNAMNAVSLAGERFLESLEERRPRIELRLLRGARADAAIRPEIGDALRLAARPSLNALFAVGVVTFPGMMTGQILAGSDPFLAARYQLLIMALWTTVAVVCPAIFLSRLGARLTRDQRLSGGFDGLSVDRFFQVRLEMLPLGEGPLAFDERPEIPLKSFEDPSEN